MYKIEMKNGESVSKVMKDNNIKNTDYGYVRKIENGIEIGCLSVYGNMLCCDVRQTINCFSHNIYNACKLLCKPESTTVKPNDELIRKALDCRAVPYNEWVQVVNTNLIEPFIYGERDDDDGYNGLFDKAIIQVSKVINVLHEGCSEEVFMKALDVFKNKGHSGVSFDMCMSYVRKYSPNGVKFYEWNKLKEKTDYEEWLKTDEGKHLQGQCSDDCKLCEQMKLNVICFGDDNGN